MKGHYAELFELQPAGYRYGGRRLIRPADPGDERQEPGLRTERVEPGLDRQEEQARRTIVGRPFQRVERAVVIAETYPRQGDVETRLRRRRRRFELRRYLKPDAVAAGDPSEHRLSKIRGGIPKSHGRPAE